jgi:hypothetical protein
MAWKSVTVQGEEITIEVDPAVDLAGGVLNGLYTVRARALLANYVRSGATDIDVVLVTAADAQRAIDKVERAIQAGKLIRRKPAG